MADTGAGDLSLEEIDSLIAEVSEPVSVGAMGGGSGPAARTGEVQLFDFRRPNKFSRDHVRALQIVNETFARQTGTILSTTLRAVSTMTLSSVDQMTYDEFVRSVPNPTVMAILSLEPLNGAGILQIPMHLAMAIIDRMLGGSGTGTFPSRPLTEIESTLMRTIIDRALAELAYSFESLVELEPAIVQFESNPQFAQVAAPSDMVVVSTYEARIGGELGMIRLCLPFSSLQPVLERAVTHSLFADRSAGDPAVIRHALTDRIEQVPVEVSVRFGSVTLTSAEIVGLREGDVLPLHHKIDDPLTLTAVGQPLLRATPGKRGKRLAVMIVDPVRTNA
jgi:flagellar motor switch protein FliM